MSYCMVKEKKYLQFKIKYKKYLLKCYLLRFLWFVSSGDVHPQHFGWFLEFFVAEESDLGEHSGRVHPNPLELQLLMRQKKRVLDNLCCLQKQMTLWIAFEFFFLLTSMYVRKNYWIRVNYRLPVFDGFTCFEVSWTRFDHF